LSVASLDDVGRALNRVNLLGAGRTRAVHFDSS